MNVNKEMMFGVLLVLMFGPDTGPLLLLFPQAMGPRSTRVRARSACLKTSLLDLLLCQLMLVVTYRPESLDCGLRAFCLRPECLAATSACVPCLPAVLFRDDAFAMPAMI